VIFYDAVVLAALSVSSTRKIKDARRNKKQKCRRSGMDFQ
jgi:hypothetical protein